MCVLHVNGWCERITSCLSLLPSSVRQKAKEIISFLQDDERLRDARKSAKKTRDKFVGYSSEDVQGKYSERGVAGKKGDHGTLL